MTQPLAFSTPEGKLICTLSSSFWLQGVSFTHSTLLAHQLTGFPFQDHGGDMTHDPVDSCTVGALFALHQKHTPITAHLLRLKPHCGTHTHNDCRHSSGQGIVALYACAQNVGGAIWTEDPTFLCIIILSTITKRSNSTL